MVEIKKHVHLIGIGGSGLSAIARVLLERGYIVSGSDREQSELLHELQAMGARISIGHESEAVQGADLVLRSSAIPEENVEVQAARKAGIPVVKRQEFLPELTAGKRVIATAGSHGKTTCTAMITWVLSALELDPSYIIGGIAQNLGSNARAGQGPHFVIEADEYDHMFWGLSPEVAVVTNVEHDHPDYFPTARDFFQAFVGFVERIQPDGILITCDSDPGAALLRTQAKEMGIRTRSYGVPGTSYTCYAKDIVINSAGGYAFTAVVRESNQDNNPKVLPVNLQVPGIHNVSNALATLAVSHTLNLPLEAAVQALNAFQGTGRRFELVGKASGVILIDDYAHHPTEIRATLKAARERYPGRVIWAVWQPHTYSRTKAMFEEYRNAFVDADQVLITEVFAAREPIPADKFSARSLAEAIQHSHVVFVPDLVSAQEKLLSGLGSNDVLLVLSAGDADQLTRSVLAELQLRAANRSGEAGDNHNNNSARKPVRRKLQPNERYDADG